MSPVPSPRVGRRWPWRWLPAMLLAAVLPAMAGDIPARLDWGPRVNLGTPVSGVIQKVSVAPGQRVDRGQVLLELDPRLFRAALKRAQATRNQAREDRDEARRELHRTREMFDRTLLSVHDRQVAEVAAATAEAGLARADADLVKARFDLEYSRVTAPLKALVLAVPAQAGETVVSRLEARTLVVLVPAGRMHAVAWVLEDALAGLSTGMPARVEVNQRVFAGHVAGVALETHGGEGTPPRYRLDVAFDVPDDAVLRPGQAATIRTGG